MAVSKRPARDDARSPDELEQRQPAHGADDSYPVVDAEGEPVSPDALEERLQEDGTYNPGVFHRVTGEALTPDMIEQLQVVEFDDEDERPDV
jgi:hypothetical protein